MSFVFDQRLLYRHKYGGIYQKMDVGISTVDLTPVVIYKHHYPFEQLTWVRPLSEFSDGRFTPITEEEYQIAITEDRDALIKRINENKKASKK